MWTPFILVMIGGLVGWMLDLQGPLGFHGFGLGATVVAALVGVFSSSD